MDFFRKLRLERESKGEFGRARASPGEDIAEKSIVIFYEWARETRLSTGCCEEGISELILGHAFSFELEALLTLRRREGMLELTYSLEECNQCHQPED